MSSLTTERVAPDSRLFTVTVAPRTGPPLESSTFPEILAETCDPAGTEHTRIGKKMRRANLGFTLNRVYTSVLTNPYNRSHGPNGRVPPIERSRVIERLPERATSV